MGVLKMVVAFVIIGLAESIADWNDKNEKYCFEIAASILMAGWIMRDGW